jgi:hypothetical protein
LPQAIGRHCVCRAMVALGICKIKRGTKLRVFSGLFSESYFSGYRPKLMHHMKIRTRLRCTLPESLRAKQSKPQQDYPV